MDDSFTIRAPSPSDVFTGIKIILASIPNGYIDMEAIVASKELWCPRVLEYPDADVDFGDDNTPPRSINVRRARDS